MSELACSVCGKGTENMRLLKRLNRVELERDKLRYVCDELTRDAISLQAENNKLRKLITDVHDALCADKVGMFHKLILASMEDDMRELGIGVD